MSRVIFYTSYLVALGLIWCAYRILVYSSDLVGAIIFLVFAFVVSPVFNNLIFELIKVKVGYWVKSFAIIFLVVCLFSWLEYSSGKEELENEARVSMLHQEKLKSQKDEVYASAILYFENAEFEKVVQATEEYVNSGYDDFLELYNLSLTEVILSKIEHYVPLRERIEMQEKLVDLNPSNETYLKALGESRAEYATAMEEVSRRVERREKIESEFSKVSGAHRGLERYLKERMKDPSSYEHIKTTYTDEGTYVLVTTQFRGTNSFGAIVLQTVRARVSLDGKVLSLD